MSEARSNDSTPDSGRGRLANLALAVGGWLGWLLMTVYARTCRVEVVAGSDAIKRVIAGSQPVLVAFWHEQLPLLAPFLFHRLHRSGQPLTLMVSQSRDGELATRILSHWKLEPVRGSSSRGGNRALRRLYRAMSDGLSPVIIPDGPRGPAHRAKPGLATLAGLSGAPILLLSAHGKPIHRIGSWDRMAVPWPFAGIRIAAELVPFAALADAPASERSRRVEARLASLGAQVAGVAPENRQGD